MDFEPMLYLQRKYDLHDFGVSYYLMMVMARPANNYDHAVLIKYPDGKIHRDVDGKHYYPLSKFKIPVEGEQSVICLFWSNHMVQITDVHEVETDDGIILRGLYKGMSLDFNPASTTPHVLFDHTISDWIVHQRMLIAK